LFAGIDGIEHAVGYCLTAFASGAQREQRVNLIRLDLASGLSFYTTPAGGQMHTLTNTITGYLADPATRAAGVTLAINAAFGWVSEPDKPAAQDACLFGLAISQGQVVCDPTVPAPAPGATQPDVPDAGHAGAVSLVIDADNNASFEIITAKTPGRPWTTIQTAVSGGPNPPPGWPPQTVYRGLQPGALLVLEAGRNNGLPMGPGQEIAARTAVGLSQDGKTMYWLTIDGLEQADPPFGATFHDVGVWMSLVGAYNAITLDGGGSTALAMINEHEQPIVINNPHGTERGPYVQRWCPQFLGVVPPAPKCSARREVG
jgi:hypothetical protein